MNEKKQELNITPFLAEAFSTNRKVYKLIDKFYNADKFKFIKLAKENEYYNHKIAQEGNIIQEYYFKKSLGILLDIQQQNNEGNKLTDKDIISIIKKGWNYAYTYVNNHSSICITAFLDRSVKKHKGIDKITDDEMNSNVLIVIMLSQYLEKDIDKNDELLKNYTISLQKRLLHYKSIHRINIDNISKDKKRELREFELKLRQENKIFFTPSSHRLSDEQQNGMLVNMNKMTKEDKYYSAFEYIYDLEDMSLIGIVGEDFLKSKEIQELIFCYTQFFKEDENNQNKIDYNELKKFLYPAIEILYLCKEYKKAKKFFFDNFNEELYEEINQKEIENREIKKDNLLLQNENENLKLQIEKLKKDNVRLQQKIIQQKQNKSELIALREHIFAEINDLNKSNNIIPIDSRVVNYDYMNDSKGVLIGGNTNWLNKFKQKLNNWNFINVDAINFDKNILKNSEFIFVNINFLSHAMYYRIMSSIENSNENIYFLNNQNIDICLEKMNNFIKENS